MKENGSVLRIIKILELISKHEHGITLGEIYRTLGIPKTTAYDILQTLYELDAVYYKDPRFKNYVIGSRLFAIGSVYTKNSNLIEASQFLLETFANTYQRLVFITKEIDEKIVYVHKYQPPTSRIHRPEEIGSITTRQSRDLIAKAYQEFHAGQSKENSTKEWYLIDSDSISTVIHCPIYNFEYRLVGILSTYDLTIEQQDILPIAEEFLSISKQISRSLGLIK